MGDEDARARVAALAIPPAWEDAWISPDPLGHIQATGVDARGRRQYLYHALWRERRDREKFDAAMRFARTLPKLRSRTERDLDADGFGRDRVLAGATRLLDKGFFRVGGEDYAEENDSYGLATLLREHVQVHGDAIVFDFPAKSSRRRVQRVNDPELAPLIGGLRRRRGGGPELLAYKADNGRWIDIRSSDLNTYIKDLSGPDFSAKCFRTWHATVLAAVVLAASAPILNRSKAARMRAKARAIDEVAEHIGNTAAVCRRSYIDPRLVDRFDAGETIAPALARTAANEDDGAQRTVERAVLKLLDGAG